MKQFQKVCIYTFSAAFLALSLSACYNVPRPIDNFRNSNLTYGAAQATIKIGQTTQSQVLEEFGAPNITTTDGSGQEVWTYQRAATASQSGSSRNYWTVIFAGGSGARAGSESSSRMLTLIIKFNDRKIVSDFRARASQF